jgi:transposase
MEDLHCLAKSLFFKNLRQNLEKTPYLRGPGPPGKFTPEQVVRILAVACEPPEKSGRPITHWTIPELVDEVITRGLVESISVSQVGRFLREAALQPHKKRYWLNTTEEDPVRFQEQVEAACDTYLAAPALA